MSGFQILCRGSRWITQVWKPMNLARYEGDNLFLHLTLTALRDNLFHNNYFWKITPPQSAALGQNGEKGVQAYSPANVF